MNTTTKAQRINKRHDAIWEKWLGGNGKDTIIQSGDELAKVTAQRDELLAALKQAAKLLEPFIRKMNIRNHFSEINAFENTIQKTIAKAESN